MKLKWIVAAATLLAALPPGATARAAAPASEPAQWQEQDLDLDYRGFTTHYSCDGLRERVRSLLVLLGARADLVVTDFGCAVAPGHIDPLPSLHLHFASLRPAAAGALAGHWKAANLGGSRGLAPGECELAEEFIATVLPRFSVRQLGRAPNCVPHNLPAVLSVPLEVFVPIDTSPAVAPALLQSGKGPG